MIICNLFWQEIHCSGSWWHPVSATGSPEMLRLHLCFNRWGHYALCNARGLHGTLEDERQTAENRAKRYLEWEQCEQPVLCRTALQPGADHQLTQLQPPTSATFWAMPTAQTPDTFEKTSLSFAVQKLHSFEGKAEQRALPAKQLVKALTPVTSILHLWPLSILGVCCWGLGLCCWISIIVYYEMRNN